MARSVVKDGHVIGNLVDRWRECHVCARVVSRARLSQGSRPSYPLGAHCFGSAQNVRQGRRHEESGDDGEDGGNEATSEPPTACTLSVERGRLRDEVATIDGPVVVTGVLTRRFDVTLQDSGWVFGIKFRPGGFASFTGASAKPLRDVRAAAPTGFPLAAVQALAQLGPSLSLEECAATTDAAFGHDDRWPEPDYATVLDIISAMLNDRSLVRVAEVERRCGVARRRMQRLFEKYVGAPPKWVLARYRIHDAVSDLDAGYAGSLADLATHYGWFDQAHFTREFTELVGIPPSSYQQR
ncbi:MAG: helix-turn-helix transcriptional regulator [Ornithinimicrobium sp.]